MASETVQISPVLGDICNVVQNPSTPSSFPGVGHRVDNGASDERDELAAEAVALRLAKAHFFSSENVRLEDRLRDENYCPPALLPLGRVGELGSSWTWLGPVDRFELVKSCKRSQRWRKTRVGESHPISPGDSTLDSEIGCVELTDDELEWVVSCHEVAELLLSRVRPAEAALLFEAVIDVSPSDVLAHIKLALALLAADAEAQTVGSQQGSWGESEVAAARRLRVPTLLRHAVMLDPSNGHLKGLVDLILRVLARSRIPDQLWAADVPRSPGIDLCLLAMLRR